MKSDDLTILAEGKIRIAPCGQRMRTYIVRCICGKRFTALQNNVNRGHTKSCGCLKYRKSTYHGLRGTPTYSTWDSMVQRCTNPKAAHYRNYGARGITVCAEWRDFRAFHQWAIANGWAEGLIIDRKNNDGNYEPDNCHWVTRSISNLNKRNNRFIAYNGVSKTIKEWSDLTGLHFKTIQGRVDILKWDVEKTLTTPPGKSQGGRYAHLFRDIRA